MEKNKKKRMKRKENNLGDLGTTNIPTFIN